MWSTFAVATAGAAAGLTGLTFIVVAFRFDTIATSTEYRNRAAQALLLFVSVIVAGLAVTVPQPGAARGLELAAVGVLSGLLLIRSGAAARRAGAAPAMALLIAVHAAFAAMMVVGGVLDSVGWPGGMYLYAASAALGISWGVYGAWIFLTRAGISDPPAATTDHTASSA